MMPNEGEKTVSYDKIVDIWLHHMRVYWRSTFVSPALYSGIIIAWFGLETNRLSLFGNLVLGLGVIIALLHFIVIRRITQYAGIAFDTVKKSLPDIPRPLLGIGAHKIALIVPIIFAISFIVLLHVDLPVSSENNEVLR